MAGWYGADGLAGPGAAANAIVVLGDRMSLVDSELVMSADEPNEAAVQLISRARRYEGRKRKAKRAESSKAELEARTQRVAKHSLRPDLI